MLWKGLLMWLASVVSSLKTNKETRREIRKQKSYKVLGQRWRRILCLFKMPHTGLSEGSYHAMKEKLREKPHFQFSTCQPSSLMNEMLSPLSLMNRSDVSCGYTPVTIDGACPVKGDALLRVQAGGLSNPLCSAPDKVDEMEDTLENSHKQPLSCLIPVYSFNCCLYRWS